MSDNTDTTDRLIPDPMVAKELGVSLMSLWRWTRDPKLDFPPPVKIRQRNYRSQRALDAWRARLVRKGSRAA